MADRTRGSERFGWGPSALASPEERELYEAQQTSELIRAGQATIADLPEAYGGRPQITAGPSFNEQGQPVGRFRRQLRMQELYDEEQKQALEQQRIMQQMETNQKELALREREQQSMEESRNIARDAAVAKAAREAKVKEQATAFMQSVIGATLPDGTRTRPINVNDDDAVERLQRAMYMNPFGMEDQYAKETATMMLDDAMRIREQRASEVAAQNKAAIEARVGIAKDLAQSGLSIADYSKDGVVDFEAANTALGEALRKKEEGREAAIDEREQRRSLLRQKATAETELVKIKSQVGRFEKLRPTGDNVIELEAARVSQGIFEDEINRINRELGVEPQSATPTPAGQRPALGDIFGGQ